MTKIFIAHRVKDYGAWKINYDADTDRRASAGFSEGAITTAQQIPILL